MVDVARARKLAVRIREIVAATLEMQVKDPRLGMVTITDTNGETISWASAGTVGFKGARKSTPFAAGRAAAKAASEARKSGMVEVEVKVKGPGSGREQAILQLQNAGLKVVGIEDVTPLPHNGCRPPKKRRV